MKAIRWFRTLRARFCHVLWRKYAKLRGATVDETVAMNGRPLIRCVKGAELILGKGVRINTSVASNPVIGRSRSSLSALCPGARLLLDERVGASGVCIAAALEVTVGADTILGADTFITDTDFHLPDASGGWRNAAGETAMPVRIGKGCFIGARVIILKGVTIGDGAVVGAGAVVCRDVPAAHLAAGNPATSRPLGSGWLHHIS